MVDTSPLIYLARTQNIHLLRTVSSTIVVPAPVRDEVRAKASDESASILEKTPWLIHVAGSQVPAEISRWDLGAGESSVLAWAQAHAGSIAILDDGKGRRVAQELRLPLIGTLGIVLRAKRLGVIPLARPVVEDLIGSGMYLSAVLVREALALMGE